MVAPLRFNKNLCEVKTPICNGDNLRNTIYLSSAFFSSWILYC